MIFDTHVHYEDDAFEEDRDRLVSSLPEHGIRAVVNVSSTLESLKKTEMLTERYSFVYGAFGIHPDDVEKLNDRHMEEIRSCCRSEKAVAVGEIGLDYHWGKENREIQMYWFRRQLQLAAEEKKPVIIHSRDAAEDTLRICRELQLEEIGGVMHCFSYSKEMAREYLEMGVYLGIGGVVTFKNARKLKEVVQYAPIDQIVLETDCPYLAPEPNRGKRNSSLNLPYVIQKIAELKGITAEETEEITWQNARKLYHLCES